VSGWGSVVNGLQFLRAISASPSLPRCKLARKKSVGVIGNALLAFAFVDCSLRAPTVVAQKICTQT